MFFKMHANKTTCTQTRLLRGWSSYVIDIYYALLRLKTIGSHHLGHVEKSRGHANVYIRLKQSHAGCSQLEISVLWLYAALLQFTCGAQAGRLEHGH